MPWGAGGYYGAQAHAFHPGLGAPLTEPSGGVLYFDSGSNLDTVMGALGLMHAPIRVQDYAVFVSEAKDPRNGGFLVPCRLVPFGALGHFFHVNSDSSEGGVVSQPMTLGGFVRGFIEPHEKRCGTRMCRELRGAMAGDGE